MDTLSYYIITHLLLYDNRCGTKPDLHGQFYENTVVVQYDKDLLEVWDEAKRLRCEWYNDYEKTASKPPMVIADLDVIQLDFRGRSYFVLDTYTKRALQLRQSPKEFEWLCFGVQWNITNPALYKGLGSAEIVKESD